MYIIAIIKNSIKIKALHINCVGNVPINSEACLLIETSGFYKFVSEASPKNHISHNNKINISSGQNTNPALIGEICNFVNTTMNRNRLYTKRLFTMIMELMTNTVQHAYSHNIKMNSCWYIFVEDCDDGISFVFLDTGAGIPNTIRRNFSEIIKSMVENNDAHFIASALRGEFRTETREKYRGKGLPEIYNCVINGNFFDFCIISSKGKCYTSTNGDIIEQKINSNFMGSLFKWKISKDYKEVAHERTNN